jgi:hypothetical protein
MFKYLLGKRETIFYENADEGIRCDILNKFKEMYSDETTSEFLITYSDQLVKYNNTVMNTYNFIVDEKKICFINKLNLIKFIQNLKRPFILKKCQSNTDDYYVYFVY